jgi:hypothetical protein
MKLKWKGTSMKLKTTQNEMLPEKFARLRRQAEERIKQWPDLASYEHADLLMVVNELRIHLAELEIQSEELRGAIKEMVARQDKDDKMYDFGPLKEETGKLNRDYDRVCAHRDVVFKRANEEK